MRRSMFVTLSVPVLTAAVSAFAASDVFLKIDGVEGESTRQAAAGVQVSSFSWGATQSPSTRVASGSGAGRATMQDASLATAAPPRDAASGLPTGKRQHKPVAMAADGQMDATAAQMRSLSVVLPASASATVAALDRACASGNHIEHAQLRTGAEHYQLSDVVVSSCAASESGRKYEFRGHVTLMK